MANRELAKAARTYGHDTSLIVQSATRSEALDAEVKACSSSAEVQAVTNFTTPKTPKRYHNEPDGNRYNSRDDRMDRGPPRKRLDLGARTLGKRSRCSRCDRQAHHGAPCPAIDKDCRKCGRKGHFAAACRKKQNAYALSLSDVLISCTLNSSSPLEFLIDSGADVNIIGVKHWKQLQNDRRNGQLIINKIEDPKTLNLRAYASEQPMKIECAFKAEVAVAGTNNPAISVEFLVVPCGRRSLLGRVTASEMKLLKVSSVNTFETDKLEVFPKMPGVRVKFSIDRSVPPEKNAYYNVPAAFREGARARLQEMEKRGIIEKVTSAPEWISGMSAVSKGKDDFRLVVNMRAPNKAIKREYFRLPLIQEMKTKLHGAKFFSKLDLTSAFYHLELSKESRDLTTFLAENGMYRFIRLMFGVNCAPEVFQREMSRILENVENVIIYIDDILVFGKTLEDLHKTVARVLQILRVNNLTLNTAKCEFDKTRIKFLGHELNEQGFHIDDSKVKNILNFREPATASELRSFLGLASFVSPYIGNFSDLTGPLWEVATTKTWNWGAHQAAAFEATKRQIAKSTSALGYFAEADKTILYTDASPTALGAVLVQENENSTPRIISFASKALTPTERKYAQNQREALSAVWAVEYFSYYLLGRHFTLRTDAKGVEFLLNRSREISKRALTRADGWALRLSPYSYVVEYVEGKFNIADPSSRLYNGKDDPFDEEASAWEIAKIEANAVGFVTEDEIRKATEADEILSQIPHALDTGYWPKQLHRYQIISHDLHFKDGILVKQGCAVIPEALRRKTLEVAHEGHPSTAKLKSILRERVWWPGMPKDAESWVESCGTCATNGKPEKCTPMERIFAPKTVWELIALDFNGPYAKFGGISILVLVEYRSRYIMAHPVKSTSFEHTRKILDEIFDKEGFPKTIKTDNGPPFCGEEFKIYCAERGIRILYSTPLFPQQNGLVENSMKLINKAMAAAVSSGTNHMEELNAAIRAHNAAAHTITKVEHDNELLDKRDREVKLKAKKHEDKRRCARECRILPGDCVIVEQQSRSKGDSRFGSTRYTVLEQSKGSLLLTNDDGKLLKRHVTQTKRVKDWRSPTHENHKIQAELRVHPTRPRKAPAYLDKYVRVVQEETNAQLSPQAQGIHIYSSCATSTQQSRWQHQNGQQRPSSEEKSSFAVRQSTSLELYPNTSDRSPHHNDYDVGIDEDINSLRRV
ncbi:uncharacterized protein K02A2.6-like [Topomyia yanbarensis]|uniref:uncharacterized protein K02A2.6-like n=1 Tax=Topomyia yanbarensis TaxID=2498891 RepID=UPI00273C3260|nr:uncharacterized protein K02A2.6-like [Topomyia yanbarensis]